ncbi:hypothetical protein ACFQX6_08895 [Streptosporangium lutulentum]
MADLMYLNPVASYIEFMRNILIESHNPPHWIWISCTFWAIFSLVLGFWYFWRAEEKYGRG